MDIESIITLVMADPSLSKYQKEELDREANRKKLGKLLSGAAGVGLVSALDKFKSMSKPTQVILGALGFGAGVLVYDYVNRKKFSTYNSDTNTYEIDTDRF